MPSYTDEMPNSEIKLMKSDEIKQHIQNIKVEKYLINKKIWALESNAISLREELINRNEKIY